MAKLTTAEMIEAIKELSVLELDIFNLQIPCIMLLHSHMIEQELICGDIGV